MNSNPPRYEYPRNNLDTYGDVGREALRKKLEKSGIMEMTVKAFAALMDEETFPEDPLKFYTNFFERNLRQNKSGRYTGLKSDVLRSEPCLCDQCKAEEEGTVDNEDAIKESGHPKYSQVTDSANTATSSLDLSNNFSSSVLKGTAENEHLFEDFGHLKSSLEITPNMSQHPNDGANITTNSLDLSNNFSSSNLEDTAENEHPYMSQELNHCSQDVNKTNNALDLPENTFIDQVIPSNNQTPYELQTSIDRPYDSTPCKPPNDLSNTPNGNLSPSKDHRLYKLNLLELHTDIGQLNDTIHDSSTSKLQNDIPNDIFGKEIIKNDTENEKDFTKTNDNFAKYVKKYGKKLSKIRSKTTKVTNDEEFAKTDIRSWNDEINDATDTKIKNMNETEFNELDNVEQFCEVQKMVQSTQHDDKQNQLQPIITQKSTRNSNIFDVNNSNTPMTTLKPNQGKNSKKKKPKKLSINNSNYNISEQIVVDKHSHLNTNMSYLNDKHKHPIEQLNNNCESFDYGMTYQSDHGNKIYDDKHYCKTKNNNRIDYHENRTKSYRYGLSRN